MASQAAVDLPQTLELLKSYWIIAHEDTIGHNRVAKREETKSTGNQQQQHRRGGQKTHVCEHSVSKCVHVCVCVGFELSTQAGLAGSQQGYIAPCQAEEAPSGGADRLSEPQKYCNTETEMKRDRERERKKTRKREGGTKVPASEQTDASIRHLRGKPCHERPLKKW